MKLSNEQFLALNYPACQYRKWQVQRIAHPALACPCLCSQNEKMEMTSDMMGDAVDDAMGVSGTRGVQGFRGWANSGCDGV